MIVSGLESIRISEAKGREIGVFFEDLFMLRVYGS